VAVYHLPAHVGSDDTTVGDRNVYAWLVFAMTFGLLLSDYMSRQVLNVVFPLLKSEWGLSDARLGALSGVVSLSVGILALPLSIVADRWGRVRSLVLMAGIWSLATLACSLAQGFGQMLTARLFVGVGEAAYGSVGAALVLGVFPVRLRATLTGAFLGGGMIGSVLGISLGGYLAGHFGWRTSFAGMALFGLALTTLYPLVVTEARLKAQAHRASRIDAPRHVDPATYYRRPPLRNIVSSRSVICVYVASGLQLFVSGALLVWMPSYLHRFYDLPVQQAGLAAAVFVLTSAAGMTICGNISDRFAHGMPQRQVSFAMGYCLLSCGFLIAAFSLPPGTLQLPLIALGMFLAAAPIHGSAFAVLSLANNLLGLALGPVVIGWLADGLGLQTALNLAPLTSIGAVLVLIYAKRHYAKDLQTHESRFGFAAPETVGP
jgi:MFS family permease